MGYRLARDISVAESIPYHETHGLGSPIVLLSGFAADHQLWTFHRDALAARHRLILIDNRGSGRSSGVATSAAEMADDVSLVLRSLGVEQAHILGHSLGGAIAQEFALRYPESVKSLLLVSTFAEGASVRSQVFDAWIRAFEAGVDEKIMLEEVLPWLYSDRYLDHPYRARSIVGFLRSNRHPPTLAGMRGQMTAIRNHDVRDRLGSITAPTLVACGELDRLTPLSLSNELAAKIPDSRSIILRSAGHSCMLEDVDGFVSLVLDFCQS